MFSGGDPQLDREVRSEIRQRRRWKQDVLVLVGGIIILGAIVLLAGLLFPAPASAATYL